LLFSAMLTTFFSRASLTTCCQSPTTAVDSPCARQGGRHRRGRAIIAGQARHSPRSGAR
jgi:hypothetical protein